MPVHRTETLHYYLLLLENFRGKRASNNFGSKLSVRIHADEAQIPNALASRTL